MSLDGARTVTTRTFGLNFEQLVYFRTDASAGILTNSESYQNLTELYDLYYFKYVYTNERNITKIKTLQSGINLKSILRLT